ncbi:MAG: CehA/McbA family metallohydrolase [Planctomycetes bacterium]|nr:CehA/McbA family metallohydrolase [Planctomycetota bacterium]
MSNGGDGPADAEEMSVRFETIDLAYNFPQPDAEGRAAELAGRMPRGSRRFWGIPYELASEGATPNVLRLSEGTEQTVRVGAAATHLCFLHYWEGKLPEGDDAGGQPLGEYEVRYADGESESVPIRCRFEVGWDSHQWGQALYAAVGHEEMTTLDFMSQEARRSPGWGGIQCDTGSSGMSAPWVFALINPRPEREIASVLLRCDDEEALCVVGLTLYEGPGHPLRHAARRYFKLGLPEGAKAGAIDVDLGVLVRDAGPARARGDQWLEAVEAGLGVPAGEGLDESCRLLEISAADGATLTVDTQRGNEEQTYRLSVGKALHEGVATDRNVRLEVVHPERTWLEVTIRDEDTGQPIPARVHFSGPNGEYYAPYGHHTVINDNWFEDYGADVKLGQMDFAYVQGKFRTKLPVGEVYVEINKGFEYEPVRRRVRIEPGQRELALSLKRLTDWRSDGWITADTHVHFISPQTAWLQGQAEGLNLINLLASQWGRLYTNFGDITGKVGVEDDDTMVWVGTENRHHILGHISMLGAHGQPVLPMCAGGPGEAYVGDPEERTLAEWADECRSKEGVVIRPHFPQPNLENPVDIVLGKFDGLEIRYFPGAGSGPLDDYNLREYYRYLNCGYRVACVGGTDKMSAGMPVGGVRTYAQLEPDRPFNFENWGEAVRAGRTFSTSGPLMDLKVDGRPMGAEVRLTGGRGTVEVEASAECAWPISQLEVVMNGKVVAQVTEGAGAKSLRLHEKVEVKGSCWLAARASSALHVQHAWPIFVAAHTSPIYVVVPDSDLFNPSDATYMLTLIDGGLTYLDTLSVRYDEQRHREMKAIYQHARDHLLGRMHSH